nr:hypothetical protein [uncultured Pseudomonas sp.]
MEVPFWRRRAFSPDDLAITASIKALKTLTVHDGRVSIDPQEVLDQPGYVEARQRAAKLVMSVRRGPVEWHQIDQLGLLEWSALIAGQLQRARTAGLSYGEAVESLKNVRLGGLEIE